MRVDLLNIGRSLSELGRSLRWTDLRAFLGSLGVESNFWAAVAPEVTARARRRAELMKIDNQLLMMVYDAVWDTAYASAGSDHRPQRLLQELLGRIEGGESMAVPEVVDRDGQARSVAEKLRSEASG